jgi:hypothetical protein
MMSGLYYFIPLKKISSVFNCHFEKAESEEKPKTQTLQQIRIATPEV